MFMRLVMVSLMAFVITALCHYYIFLRLVLPLPSAFHAPGAAIFFGLWSLAFFGFPIARAVPYRLRQVVELLMYFWMGAVYFFLLLCLITEPVDLYLTFFQKTLAQSYLAISVFVAGLVLIVWGLYTALRPETIIETVVPIRSNLSQGLESFKAILLTDIHVAGLIGRRRMRRLANRVMKHNPDIIFIGGDLVDGSVRQLRRAIAPLRELRARCGIYYVTGNHEYYCNAKRWKQFVTSEFGWHVLANDHAEVKVDEHTIINLYGIEDRQSLRGQRIKVQGDPQTSLRKVDSRLATATRNVDNHSTSNRLNILLAHQPKDARSIAEFPFIDLQLSGHTHGGQFWPLYLFVKSDQTYVKGLYKTLSLQHIYVSQGTGFWGPPMRFGTQCEISILRFKRSEA